MQVQPAERCSLRAFARPEPTVAASARPPAPHGEWPLVLRRVEPPGQRGALGADRRQADRRQRPQGRRGRQHLTLGPAALGVVDAHVYQDSLCRIPRRVQLDGFGRVGG